MEADKDCDGRLSFEEFTNMVANTVSTRRGLASHTRLLRAPRSVLTVVLFRSLFRTS